MADRICPVEGCSKPRGTRTHCAMHAYRLRVRGSLGGPEPEIVFGLPLAERIAAKLVPADGGCIVWTGHCDPNGYGRIGTTARPGMLVHRAVWTEAHGQIPPGMFVCHRCDNPPCSNLEHLFLGTPADNAGDMVRKGRHGNTLKTHCVNGHEFTPENTGQQAHGARRCRTCTYEGQARRRNAARLVGRPVT
jgi:HNH endonuclease